VTLAARTIDGLTPREVASPSTAEELASALKAATNVGHAVAAVGGGTQLDLGMPPARLDLVIETTRLNKVVEYEPADLTVTVEAGMRFSELQRILGEQGQMLALDPPVEASATVGGVIATNASGPLRFAYGTARDLVIGTRVANPDGTITHAGGRVVKNVAGYDLNKLYIGSLGTLAILVELSFKLAPIPPSTATVVGSFETSANVHEFVSGVMHSPLSPLAIELIGSRKVFIRMGGYEPAVERQVRDLSRLVADVGGEVLPAAPSLWDDIARARVASPRRDIMVKATAPVSQSTRLVEILEHRLAELRPTVWAHAGNGVAYAACNAPESGEALVAARQDVCALGSNAALVIERCPTALKQEVNVWGDPGPSLALMRSIKAKLDPNNTLNPGRYVGGI
jgi:glycolate dehydrogenase FAD-binding subunit